MKKRKLLSALLAASLLCSTTPAVAWAEDANTEPVANEQASARSGEMTIEGGTEGVDYKVEDGVVTILTDKSLTFPGQNYQYNIKVPEGVTANITLRSDSAESADITIQELSAGSVLNLSQAGDYISSVFLGDYNSSEISGDLVINDADGSGNIILWTHSDISGEGSVSIRNGDVDIPVYNDWSLKNFTVYQGNVNFSFHDQYFKPENFNIHGGNILFDLADTTKSAVVHAGNCTITGGNIAVQDRRELNNNIFQDDFGGIIGADAELENYNSYDNGRQSLIQAEQYNISGGNFYEANLSANTVYGCPVNQGMTLKVIPFESDEYSDRYSVYSVVPNGSVSHLDVSGSNYEQDNRTVTLKDGAIVTVATSGQTSDQIVVEDDANATLTLQGVDMLNSKPPISLGSHSTLTLVLADGSVNNVKTIGELGHAAIETKGSSALTIRGTGELNATGTAGGAAIGTGEVAPGYEQSIIIEDGDINAYGGYEAAGIGGGKESWSVSIEISGGIINANGQSGIGDGTHSQSTDITITGGNIRADGNDGAGIGGGLGSTGSNVWIEGGSIEAYGASGIGSGNGLSVNNHAYNSTIDNINISGGYIHAEGYGGAGIGGGRSMGGAITSVGRIRISGGVIDAQGSAYGIGAGQGGIGGTLKCYDAVIIANSISDMAHQGNWNGLFFVDTINRGFGTILGGSASLQDDYVLDRPVEIKEGQILYIPEDVTLTNNGAIEIQEGGRLTNEGSLVNDGYIVVYPGGEYVEYGDGSFSGTPIEYIDQDQPNPDDTAVTGVQLNKKKLSLKPGASKKLVATVLPETAENKDVTWSSSDKKVAKVNAKGKVTAVAEGTAVITVTTADGGYTAECKVSVSKGAQEEIDVESVVLNKKTLSLKAGASETLTATVSPDEATDKSIRWTSSNADVATVDANGKVTAVANGTAVITAATVDGGFTAQCTVTVSDDAAEAVAVANVTLDKSSLTMDVGETEQLTATITPENATNQTVRWKSNNEDVVSVDAKGKLIAIDSGTATVTVTTEDGNFTALCKVTVVDPDDTTTDTETKPDGSTVTTVEDVNGSSSTTTVAPNGTSTTTVTLSDAAIDAAAKNDAAVILPMVGVTASKYANTAPSVTVDLPGQEAVKVEIPVFDMTPGTVAMLVDAAGNETILKNSVLGNNGLIVTLSDGDTVKIFDNTQAYSDVADHHWAKDNIDYVTSRGLFVGVSDDQFAPETAMTRAMIVSVLQRYDGDTTTAAPGAAWYEGARQWAMAQGISDGENMNGNVTREQLVTMLYRFVGSPQVDGSLAGFADSSAVSPYAEQAMIWAVRNGIIGGMTADTLGPQGQATRAQVAAILERFIALEEA